MGRLSTQDMSVFSVNSVDLLALLKDCSIKTNFDIIDGKPITRMGKSAHQVKKGAVIDYTNFSTVSQPQRVTNINVTAMSIAGTDYIGTCRSGTFSGSYTHVEGSGIGDIWKAPYVTEKDYRFSGEFQVVDSATANIWQNNADEIFANNLTSGNITLSFTINSITFTLPCSISSAEWKGAEGGLQTVSLELMGRSPDSGAYPTAPTGTTTLLEKALNAPGTALAFSSTNTSNVSYDVNIACNAIIQAFSIEFADAALVLEKYTWASTGTVTPTV